MADILDFRPSEGKTGRRGSSSGGAGCEIVIFPGVRYERWDRSAAPQQVQDAPKPARKRVKRDTLEIMD